MITSVLSLFDGISCGQVALNRAGVFYKNYYASEIDKSAIKVTQHHHPKTIQLGDVVELQNIDFDVDLLLGGSPCQSFSIAGNGSGFEGKSKLFFEYARIFHLKKPRYFLFENVKMKSAWRDIITDHLGVEPIELNSDLVSAQRRVRYYWTNIPFQGYPQDKEVFLKDILESGFVDRQKDFCLDANYFKGGNPKTYFTKSRRQLVFQINPSKEAGGKQPRMQNRVYHPSGKCCSLTQFANRLNVGEDMLSFRKLSPVECERLQTLPDNYTKVNGVSESQRYKMLGNGWNVDTIVHLIAPLNKA